jgi:hypothetical protein
VLELLKQLACQADRPVSVVSDCAVDNLDFQHKPSLLADVEFSEEVASLGETTIASLVRDI